MDSKSIYMNSKELSGHELRDKICELELINENLRKANFLYHSIFEKLPFGLQVFDKDGFAIKINSAQKEMLGLPDNNEGIGKFNVITDPHSVTSGASELYLDAYNGVQKEHEFEYDLGVTENNWDTGNDKKTFKEFIIPVNDENGAVQNVVAVIEDVTEQKRSTEELISTKLRAEKYGRNFENIFTNSPIGIFVIDIDQNGKFFINASNPNHEKLFDIQNEKISGKPLEVLQDLFGKDTYDYVKKLYEKIVLTRETITIEESILLNNKQVQLSTTIRPISDESGRIHRLIGTNLDITALKSTEKELIIAKEKAEESDKLKSAFLQNISHEVRTPLNAIVGFSSIIADRISSDEDLKSFAQIITFSSDRLIGIIMDVIEISQIQTSQTNVTLSEIKLETLITKVVNPFYDKAKNVKTEMVLHKENIDADTVIFSDEWKLERIIFQILDNAIKFTQRGSIEIHIELLNETLKIGISDTGIGIEKEHQHYIFDPFRQVDTETHNNYGGLGLGLTLVKAYVKLLLGHLSFETEFGKGTKVTVEIPAKKFSRSDIIENRRDLITNNNSSKEKIVLIAEDDMDSFLFLKEVLESEDIIVLHACNGLIAVEMCKSIQEITLVLMDFKMPVMDGKTAAKLIKQIRPDLPIIGQSAYADDNNHHTIFENFDDYVAKPVKMELLKSKISTYLQS